MPTYDYECLECKDRFEVFQSMTEDPVKICPKCGGKVRKLISAGAGIIFKGSGFYVNDYKKNTGSADPVKKPAATDKTNGSSNNSDTSSTPASTATPVAEPKKSTTESTTSTPTT